jgi:hypothetical protein
MGRLASAACHSNENVLGDFIAVFVGPFASSEYFGTSRDHFGRNFYSSNGTPASMAHFESNHRNRYADSDSYNLLRKPEISATVLPLVKSNPAPGGRALGGEKEKKSWINGFETFGAELETSPDSFIWNRCNPLKSPDS